MFQIIVHFSIILSYFFSKFNQIYRKILPMKRLNLTYDKSKVSYNLGGRKNGV
jgi:hypothetical protein